MLKRVCDGCAKELNHEYGTVIQGENVGILCGAGLPDPGEPFHWCDSCAIFAFRALKEKHA